jgi:hypothetical protein
MTPARNGRLLLIAAGVAVIAAIIAAIALEPPEESRKRRLDDRRVQDLSKLETVISEYWRRQQKLPSTLDALSHGGLHATIADPESNQPYEYAPSGERSYRLCANFVLETGDPSRRPWPAHTAEWSHGAGRHCFERTVRTRQE